MNSLIAAGLLSLSSPAVAPPSLFDNLIPTVNLSAIRQLVCTDEKNPTERWTGSGSIIGDGIVLTDLHVSAGGNCIDAKTGVKLTMYYKDEYRDMALMAGAMPVMPPIKISCARYKRGQEYSAYGISGFYADFPMFRQISVISTGDYLDLKYSEGGGAPRISYLKGFTVPGMSGGPITNRHGEAVGNVVAGEHNFLGIPTGKAYSYEFADTVLCKKGPSA